MKKIKCPICGTHYTVYNESGTQFCYICETTFIFDKNNNTE